MVVGVCLLWFRGLYVGFVYFGGLWFSVVKSRPLMCLDLKTVHGCYCFMLMFFLFFSFFG